jgi:hypothetical protein
MCLFYTLILLDSVALYSWNEDLIACFSHGTRCAGAAVSKANNEICGVGVAYGASIAG